MPGQIYYSQVLLTYPQCSKSKEELLEWIKTLENICCAVVCQEDHHETDGQHLHAWIKFNDTMRTRKWGTLFDWGDVHGNYERVTVNPKSIAHTVEYVMKDGNYVAWNCDVKALTNTKKSHERKYNNERILKEDLKKLVDEGVINIKDLPAYQKAKDAYYMDEMPKYTKNTKGIWIWGDAGVGKSKWCTRFGRVVGSWYEKPVNKWFDGYDDQEVIIMNEVKNNVLIKSGYLMKWADNEPCKGEVKGGTRWLRHRYILITSNDDPMDLCRDETGHLNDADWEPIARRFRIIHVTKEGLREGDLEYMPFRREDVFDNPWCEFEDVIPDAANDIQPPPAKQPPTDDTHEE